MIGMLVALLLSGGGAGADGGVPARDKSGAKNRLIQLLQREPAAGIDEMRNADPDLGSSLGALVKDRTAATKVRVRAIESLAEIAPEQLDVDAVIANSADEDAVRVSAMKAALKVRGGSAVDASRHLLADPKASLRIAAADGLARVSAPEAREALRERLDAETEPAVRSALERALARNTP